MIKKIKLIGKLKKPVKIKVHINGIRQYIDKDFEIKRNSIFLKNFVYPCEIIVKYLDVEDVFSVEKIGYGIMRRK